VTICNSNEGLVLVIIEVKEVVSLSIQSLEEHSPCFSNKVAFFFFAESLGVFAWE